MDDLLKGLIQAAMTENKKEITDYIKKVLYQFSLQVSDAVCPLNEITAPFVINILRVYAKTVANTFPGSEGVADALDDALGGLR